MRRRSTSSYPRVHACPCSVWGFPCLRTGVDLAIGLKDEPRNSPAVVSLPPLHEICFHRTLPRCRAPWLVRCLSTYSHCESLLPGRSRGRAVVRSRSGADRLGDRPDETDELTGHRRNGDVLELAPPKCPFRNFLNRLNLLDSKEVV